MRIALAQINPTIGDVVGNAALILDAVHRARERGADVVVTPELAVLGYPPRDLLLREGVVEACEEALWSIAEGAGDLPVVVGHPRRAESGLRGVRNSASVCHRGRVVAVYDKRLLPGYDVFDEDRYFDPGERSCATDLPAGRIGLLICEDLWRATDVTANPRYAVDPLEDLMGRGCDALVCMNASPFVLHKIDEHLAQARTVARRIRLPIVVVNQVGGQDDLVFAGRSFAVDAEGAPRLVLPGWEEHLGLVDTADLIANGGERVDGRPLAAPRTERDHLEDVFRTLVLGVADYCRKTGHDRVLIGLSGGIDSALTAAIAVAALGARNVSGVLMPSRYSSPGSIGDAVALARNLGLAPCERVGIEEAHEVMGRALETAGGVPPAGVTDENVQARLRGIILMARSNASGALVLSTSNKSELAVGYSTLYGDMCGALSVLGDVLKTRVYELASWINENRASAGFTCPPIPEASFRKPPSAELRPDQTDQDTLPPYDVLDEIVMRYVEQEHSAARIARETGLDASLVEQVTRDVDRAEYKRHQAAVILKISQRAFGRGRPMPIVMRQTEMEGGSDAAVAGGEATERRSGGEATKRRSDEATKWE